MLDYTVTQILDKSGYFARKSSLFDTCKNEKEDCIYGRSVSTSREGFSFHAYFNYTNDSGTLLAATEISLRFNAGTHPYFDADTIRSTFVKVIGPPDHSDKDSDSWGKQFDGPYIWAGITKDKEYSITLRDRSMIKRKKEEDKTKKEGDKK